MKTLMVPLTVLAAAVPSTVCMWGAYQLALAGADGWGWLIFAGLLLGGSTKVSSDKSE